MLKVTSHDFQRNTGLYQDKALKEAVGITRYGRDHLVLMDVEEYNQLRKRARIVMGVNELSTDEVQQILGTNMSAEHEHLNSEMK